MPDNFAMIDQTAYAPTSDHVGPYPRLMVRYSCSFKFKKDDVETECPGEKELDAYHGPPKCFGSIQHPHRGTWMVPVELGSF